MIIKKEKQIFIFDDDKNIVKYNIENDTLTGNKDNVLLKLPIESSKEYFEDENMWFMFRDIGKKEECHTIKDVIQNLYNYKNFEQIYSAGLKVYMTPSPYGENGDFEYTIKEIPKGLRRICKEYNMYLDKRMVNSYKQNPDIYNAVFLTKDKYRGLKKTNLKMITEHRMPGRGLLLVYLNDNLGYNIRDLINYFDYMKTDLKIKNAKDMLKQYSDYVKKATDLNNDFEKYPKDFIESYTRVLNICDQNKNKKNKKRAEERRRIEKSFFENNIKHEYEIEYKDYIFIYPKSAEEIRKEGRDNHNCVATYIKDVIKGQCDILFLRKKDAPDKSLVTIEVRNGEIVQARRVCNSIITNEDREAIKYFNSIFSKKSDFIDTEECFENINI
jgi:hypothetical protein